MPYARLITACFLQATFLLFLCLVEVLVTVVVIEKYCAIKLAAANSKTS